MHVSTLSLPLLVLALGGAAPPETDEDKIASALSAAPASIAAGASVADMDGRLLREGSNGWTCLPESQMMGPMCNDARWMALLGAFMKGEPYEGDEFGLSYMLAGEAGAPGVSNIDPTATAPTEDNQWVKEGPHLMVILPDPAAYEGITTDTSAPVYVMWKDTPYAHLMVRVGDED
ncbi:hypothetical protein [Sphingomicrobium aestuariivivum]|uniref:hypothetical protein n=1 Tax=Sphingomicrobium aestuariivivum TaxID=1582356 RepID=UPI001FD72375|nr:hypothetical protein [Sphingomicrobium aestuariivivum]MCJ8190225.1 hypothetical protein [Sphingomicrobium aestuariivivum]